MDAEDRIEDGAEIAGEEENGAPPIESPSRAKTGDAMIPSHPPAAVRLAEFAPAPANIQVRQLSIPLDDGKTFDLRFPTELSKEDFDFVVENIKLWERKIVSKSKNPTQAQTENNS